MECLLAAEDVVSLLIPVKPGVTKVAADGVPWACASIMQVLPDTGEDI